MEVLYSLFTEAASAGRAVDFFQSLFYIGVVWLRVKPFLRGEVASLKGEMAKQMDAVREEMKAISNSVTALAENMKSLEKSHEKRLLTLEIRVDAIELTNPKGG